MFHVDEEGPFIYDYMVKGHLCEAARTLKVWGQLKQLQDKFKRYVFVRPRRIHLPGLLDEPLERPLRAQTAQGPRVTVVRSDVCAEGTEISYQLHVLETSGITENCLRDVLDYGGYIGYGQWRTGGWGAFEVLNLEEAEEVEEPPRAK